MGMLSCYRLSTAMYSRILALMRLTILGASTPGRTYDVRSGLSYEHRFEEGPVSPALGNDLGSCRQFARSFPNQPPRCCEVGCHLTTFVASKQGIIKTFRYE